MTEIMLELEEAEEITLEIEEVFREGSAQGDYEKLDNLPTLNGQTIIGNMNEIDPTVPAWAKEPKKPAYTPDEIGAVNENDVLTLAEIDAMFQNVFNL